MLYICKDLASKCFDWPGVGRGGPNGDIRMSQTPKIAGFLETSEADLTPFGLR